MPGQWFLDRSASPWVLSYLANAGEDPNTDEVVVPQTAVASPQVLLGNGLRYVQFSQLQFSHDNYTDAAAGYTYTRLDLPVTSAVSCLNCQNVSFDGDVIAHTSGSGIDFTTCLAVDSGTPVSPCPFANASGVSAHDAFNNGVIYDVGAHGIRNGRLADSVNDRDTNLPQFLTVQNNLIVGVGRVIAKAFPVAQGCGHDNAYAHNEVSDSYSGGFNIGALNCPPHAGEHGSFNNVVSFNRASDLGQGISNDFGCVYFNVATNTFVPTGNQALNNICHDINDATASGDANGFGGQGIYIDNFTGAVLVQNNLVYRSTSAPMNLTSGPSLAGVPVTIKNNIFAYGRTRMISIGLPWATGACPGEVLKLTASNNIFLFDRKDTSAPAFYVQGGCTYTCASATVGQGGAMFTAYEDYAQNDYWRVDGQFGTDPGCVSLSDRPSGANTPPAPYCDNRNTAAWTFLTAAEWQNLVRRRGLVMIADPGFQSRRLILTTTTRSRERRRPASSRSTIRRSGRTQRRSDAPERGSDAADRHCPLPDPLHGILTQATLLLQLTLVAGCAYLSPSRIAKKSVYYVSLGCPKTGVDTEVMLRLNDASGLSIVDAPERADVIVINTCGFIGAATEESVDTILEMAKHKQARPASASVVTGCFPQRHDPESSCAARCPRSTPSSARATSTRSSLAIAGMRMRDGGRWIRPSLRRRNAVQSAAGVHRLREDRRGLRSAVQLLHHPEDARRATQPRARERVRARSARSRRQRRRRDQPRRADLTTYGWDLNLAAGQDKRDGDVRLAASVRRLGAASKSANGSASTYAYPDHGHRRAPRRRGRGAARREVHRHAASAHPRRRAQGDAPQYVSKTSRQLVDKIRARVPGVTLRTTFIVGHPGETEEAFTELLDFVREVGFDRVGVFTYSKEEGTHSATLGEEVPAKEAERRRRELMRAQRSISRKKMKAMVGSELDVLVEGPSEESEFLWSGRHAGQRPRSTDRLIYRCPKARRKICAPRAGDVVRAESDRLADYDLAAQLTEVVAASRLPKRPRALPVLRA